MAAIIYVIAILCSSGCGPGEKTKIRVATAANVQYAIVEIAEEFFASTGIAVEVIAGSSGKLSTQIAQGAPFDIFISADMLYPEKLYRDGFAVAKPKLYANGTIVVWTMGENTPSLEAMLAEDVQHVAIPNPKTAPYGIMAVEALKEARILNSLSDRLVYGANVGQVSQFIASGAAEIGITSKSMVLSEQLKGKGKWVDIPSHLYTPIEQGVIIIDRKEETKVGTEMFYAFMFSDIAREILEDNGYKLPEQ